MGRFWVRFITWSMSRSKYMLSALADPDANAVPTSVAATVPSDGDASGIKNSVKKPVTSTNSIMVGLVSARKSCARRARGADAACAMRIRHFRSSKVFLCSIKRRLAGAGTLASRPLRRAALGYRQRQLIRAVDDAISVDADEELAAVLGHAQPPVMVRRALLQQRQQRHRHPQRARSPEAAQVPHVHLRRDGVHHLD